MSTHSLDNLLTVTDQSASAPGPNSNVFHAEVYHPGCKSYDIDEGIGSDQDQGKTECMLDAGAEGAVRPGQTPQRATQERATITPSMPFSMLELPTLDPRLPTMSNIPAVRLNIPQQPP